MTVDHILVAIIGVLVTTNVVTIGFHFYSSNKLINKIMSRNFFEYAQIVEKPKTEDQGKLNINIGEQNREFDELGSLNELTQKLLPF